MASKALTGYRTHLATVEAAGTPWHITPDATPAERIAHHRRIAADHLHAARADTTRLYRIVRRYACDARWGRVDMNPEGRPVLARIRLTLHDARVALRAAVQLEHVQAAAVAAAAVVVPTRHPLAATSYPIRLPLRACLEFAGDVLDADGLHVLTVLGNGAPPDAMAQLLASQVAHALNAQAHAGH